MATMKFNEALIHTMSLLLERDPNVFVIGEDITKYGGVFKATKGLQERFGAERVFDTPICEAGFTGFAVGAAMMGMRPIVEIMFSDFLLFIMDPLCNEAAKFHYMSGGQISVPIVVRTNIGIRGGAAAQHSNSFHGIMTHFPGLKIAVPSSPADAKGLLWTAVEDPDPVLFIENKQLYFISDEVPEGEYKIPFGKANVLRRGKDLTIVATSYMVREALVAAEELSKEGIKATVIDPRTLVPLDKETIVKSVKQTGRALIVDEGLYSAGFAQQLQAIVSHEAFYQLLAPVQTLTPPACSIPYSPPLERQVMLKADQITTAAKELVSLEP
jgi:pyruvate/2-oxoglutarate/acetoin dehydrogenase E1 component